MAEKKYHINPETGRPNQCTATVRDCKFAQGDLIPEHYDTKEDAQKAYETKMEKEQGSTSTVKKKPKSKNDTYVDPEEVERDVALKELTEDYDDYLNDYPEGRAYKKIKDNPGYNVDEKTYSKIYKTYEESLDGNYQGVINIKGYHPAISFNEGEYYHPSPEEEWHESDISYTTRPSFSVASKHAFVQDVVLDNVDPQSKYKIGTINNDFIKGLEEAGLFSESSYEAKIENDWYGDEFHGFVIDRKVKERVIEVLAEEAIIQS